MTDSPDPLARYLEALRSGLERLPAAEVDDIVAEIRSHVRDGASPGPGGVEAVLARLGPAAALASAFLADAALARAAARPWPWRLLGGLLAWGTRSIAGVVAFVALLSVYLVSASFLAAALIKPAAPDRTGLWWIGDEHLSLALGWSAAPAGGRELLGWWLIPVGLAGGTFGLAAATALGRRVVGRLRRPPLEERA